MNSIELSLIIFLLNNPTQEIKTNQKDDIVINDDFNKYINDNISNFVNIPDQGKRILEIRNNKIKDLLPEGDFSNPKSLTKRFLSFYGYHLNDLYGTIDQCRACTYYEQILHGNKPILNRYYLDNRSKIQEKQWTLDAERGEIVKIGETNLNFYTSSNSNTGWWMNSSHIIYSDLKGRVQKGITFYSSDGFTFITGPNDEFNSSLEISKIKNPYHDPSNRPGIKKMRVLGGMNPTTGEKNTYTKSYHDEIGSPEEILIAEYNREEWSEGIYSLVVRYRDVNDKMEEVDFYISLKKNANKAWYIDTWRLGGNGPNSDIGTLPSEILEIEEKIGISSGLTIGEKPIDKGRAFEYADRFYSENFILFIEELYNPSKKVPCYEDIENKLVK